MATNETPKRSSLPLLGILACTLIGVGFGYAIGKQYKTSGPGLHPHWWSLAMVPVIAIFAIGLHEGGHVAAGLAAGFRFCLYIAGPLRIERQGEQVQMKLNRVGSLWGGLAACIPQAGSNRDNRFGMALFTVGGPLFSLLGAISIWPGLALLSTQPDLGFCLLAFGILSAGVAVVTMAPIRSNGYVSDGGRLLMLLRNQPEGKRWAALAAVAGLSLVERPRDWPQATVDSLGEGEDAATDAVMACLLRHLWHLDRQEWNAAGMWLDRGLANIEAVAVPLRGGVYAAAASYFARHRNDAAAARGFLEKAEAAGLQDSKELHLVRAWVLMAEGRRNDVPVELGSAAESLAHKPAPLAEVVREELAKIQQALAA